MKKWVAVAVIAGVMLAAWSLGLAGTVARLADGRVDWSKVKPTSGTVSFGGEPAKEEKSREPSKRKTLVIHVVQIAGDKGGAATGLQAELVDSEGKSVWKGDPVRVDTSAEIKFPSLKVMGELKREAHR